MKNALRRNGLVAQLSYAIQIVVMLFYPALAYAGPGDATVESGAAEVVRPDASTTVVTQTSDRAVINWNGFNINLNELVQINQPGANSVNLGRDVSGNASSLLGQLVSNGRVFLVNPNGMVFGPGSHIDVAGLAATTFNINTADFMSGKYSFEQQNADLKAIINQGEIHVTDNGFVVLVAPAVSNEGLIIANLGKVVLGAGQKMTLDFNGDGLVTYQIDGKVLDQVTGPDGRPMRDAVSNSGTIQANGGTVVLHAQAAGAVFDSLVNNSGILEAKSLDGHTSEVRIEGSDPVENTGALGWRTHFGEVKGAEGVVLQTGSIDVSAIEAGAKGGTVTLSGQYVGVSGSIDAQGGGNVLVTSSTRTVLTASASIDVSGVGSGNAGNAVVWSDNDTLFYGTILGRGGDLGGDGASVEVSGYENLTFNGGVNLAAGHGAVGTLMLDPKILTIVALLGTLDVSLPTILEVTGGAAVDHTVSETALELAVAAITLEARDGVGDLSAGSLDNTLNLTQNITIRVTNSNGTPDGNGIKLDEFAITTTGSVTILGDTTNGAGAVPITISRPITAVGISIDTNDGSVTLTGSTLNSGAGTITVTGDTNVVVGVMTSTSAAGITITATKGSITDVGVNVLTAPQVSLNSGDPLSNPTTPGGSIGGVGAPIDTDLASLFASTQNGDIYISDVGASGIIIENVIARQGPAVTPPATNTPVLGAGGQITTSGGTGTFDVSIAAAGNVVLGVVTSPDDLTISTTAGVIIDGNGLSPNLLAQDVVLTASGAIGASVDEIDITSETTSANVTVSGGVFILLSNQGSIGSITALGLGNNVLVTDNATGTVSIGTISADSTPLTGGSVTINASSAGLSDANGTALNISGTSLTITAKGDVGTLADPINTTISGAFLVTTSLTGEKVFILDTGTPTSVGATVADSDVKLGFAVGPATDAYGANTYTFTASTDVLTGSGTGITFSNTTGGIVVGAINAGAANNVTLTASTTITDGGGTITGGIVTLTGTSIGAAGAGNQIDTAATTITATATTGGVFISELNAATVSASAVAGIVNISNVAAASDLTLGIVRAFTTVDVVATGSVFGSSQPGNVNVSGTTVRLTATAGAIGTVGTSVSSSINTLIGTATGTPVTNGLFLTDTLGLILTTATATGAGADISITAGGNLTLPAAGLSAPDSVTLSASGTITAPGVGTDITALSANLTGSSLGAAGVLFHLVTAVNTLTTSSTGGGTYIDNTAATLTLVSASAIGAGSDIEITNTGGILLGGVVPGAVTAKGDDVLLSAGGSILDNPATNVAVNVTANTLSISTTVGSIGTVADPLELDVNQLTASAPGGVNTVNVGPLVLTAASLTGGTGSYTAASITIKPLGGLVTIGGGNSLTMTTTSGSIVMLDQTDTIAVTGLGTISIDAGFSSPGSGGLAILGNLTTAGGNITVNADSHISIGLLNAGAGSVFLTSTFGEILDANGVANNIIAANLTINGNTPTTRQLELASDTWIARAEASDAEARVDALLEQLTASTANATTAAVTTLTATVNAATADVAAKQAIADSKQAIVDILTTTVTVLTIVNLVAGTAAGIAAAVAGVADSVPFTGDGGTGTIAAVLFVVSTVTNIAVTAASLALTYAGIDAGNAAADLVDASAQLYAAQSSLTLATLLDTAAQDNAAIAATNSLNALNNSLYAHAVQDHVIVAEDAANVIGTSAQQFGVTVSGIVTITAGNSNVFMSSLGALNLVSTTNIGSGTSGATNISATDLLMKASTGIGTPANPLRTTVTRLDALTATGGISVLNSGAMTLADLDAVVDGFAARVTGSGAINIRTSSPMSFTASIVGPAAIVLTAGESAAAGDDLTLGDGVTAMLVESTASSVTLQAGDAIIINALVTVRSLTASITADAGSGTVVDSGDGLGSFTSAGALVAPTISVNVLQDIVSGTITSSNGLGNLTLTTAANIGVGLLNNWVNVTLRAGTGGAGSITDANGAGINNIQATSLTVTAGDNSGAGAGANAINLDTTIATLTLAEVANNGAIVVNDVGGGLTVTRALTGTVVPGATGDITISTSGGTLTIASPTTFGASFYAASGIRNAGIEAGVAPGMGDGSGGAGNVFLSTTSANNIRVGNGSLAAFAGVPDIGASGGSVTLRANTTGAASAVLGQILDGDTFTDVFPRINIISDGLRAEAPGGFGTAANPFETFLSTVSGRYNTGGWFLNNKQSLTVGTVDTVSGIQDTDLTATFASVNVHASNLNDPAVTVAAGIIAAGQVLLQADETAGGVAGDDITVNAGIRVASTTSAVLLHAGDNILVDTGAEVAGATLTEVVAGYLDNDDTGDVSLLGTVGHVTAGGALAADVNSARVTISALDLLAFGVGGAVITTTAGAIVTLTGDANHDGLGAITDADAAVDVQAATLQATAATAIGLDTDITTLALARLSGLGGTVDINELNVTAPVSGLRLGEVTALGGSFNLTGVAVGPNATAVTDANGNANNVTADTMVITGTAGFGALNDAIETTISGLTTTPGAISGSMNVSNTGDLIVGAAGIGIGGTMVNVTLRATSITLNGSITGSGTVALTATEGDITNPGATTITANTASFIASGLDGDIGALLTPILTKATTVLLTATGTGETAISDSFAGTTTFSGSGSVGDINLTKSGGNMEVGGAGILTGGNIVLISGADILDTGGGLVGGTSVTLIAGGGDGDLGTGIAPIRTRATTLTFTGTGLGDVFITELNGSNVSGVTGRGVITLVSTTGDWNVTGAITTTGAVSVSSLAGDVVMTAGFPFMITGASVNLAGGGVDGDVGFAAAPIRTATTGSLGALTFTGSGGGEVAITEFDGATVTGPAGSGNVILTTTNGAWLVGAAGIAITSGGLLMTANGAGGQVTDVAGAPLSVGGLASFDTVGIITLGNAGGGATSFGTLTLNGTVATVYEDSPTTFVGTSLLSTSLSMTSTLVIDNVTNTSLTVTGNASFTGTELNIGNAADDTFNFGSLTVNASGPTAFVHEDSATLLTGANFVTGTFTLNSAGAITDAAGTSIGNVPPMGALQFTAGGAITLGDSATDTINVTGNATFSAPGFAISLGALGLVDSGATVNFGSIGLRGTTATVFEDSSMVLAAVNVTTLNVTATTNAGDAITDSGTVIVTGTLTATARNGIVLDSTTNDAGTINLFSGTGGSTFTDATSFTVGTIVASIGVVLNSLGGSIFSDNVAVDITAPNLAASAVTGVGTALAPLATTNTFALVFSFEATTSTGGVFLDNRGPLTIGGVNLLQTGISAIAGDIRIRNISNGPAPGNNTPFFIDESVSTSGSVTLESDGVADSPAPPCLDDMTVDFDAAVVSSGSSVTMNSEDDILVNGSVSAGTTVTLNAGLDWNRGGVDLDNCGSVVYAGGPASGAVFGIDVVLTSPNDLVLGTVIAVNSATLFAGTDGTGSITDVNGAATNIFARSLSMTARDSINVDVEVERLTLATLLDADALGNPFLAAGTINIRDRGGDMTVDTVLTTNPGDAVTLSSTGGLTDGNGATVNVTTPTLTLRAGTGNIDLDTNIITLASANISGVGNMDISNANTWVIGTPVGNVTTANGNINLSNLAGDMRLQGGLAAGTTVGTGRVTLNSFLAIVDENQDTLNVTGFQFVAVAGTGIGVDAGLTIDPIESNVRFFEARAGAGVNARNGVYLRNIGSLTIGGIGALTGVAGGGAADIRAASPQTVSANVVMAGAVLLVAGETSDAGVFADDLTINTGVTVQSIFADTTLLAGDDVIVGGTVIAATTATLTAGSGDLDTGGSVTDSNGPLVNVVAPSVILSATGVTGGIDLDLTTVIVTATVTNAGAIDLSDSAAGLTIGVAGVSTANGSILVNATAGTLTVTGAVTAAGAGADVTLTTTGSGDIALGAGAANVTATDVVNLNASGAITDGDAASDVTAVTLNATAATGIDVDTTITNLTALVTGVGAIDVSDSAGGMNVLSAVTQGVGTITLAAASGNLALGTVNANSGASAVNLTTTVSGAITDLNGGAVNVIGSTLTATAINGIDLDTTIATLVASVTGPGAIDVNETNGLLVTSATTINGNITVLANDDLTATLVTAGLAVASGNGNIVLTSVNGSVSLGSVTAALDRVDVTAGQGITDGLAGEAANLTTTSLVLRSGTGVGTGDDINTVVTNLEGAGGSGGFTLTNTGALTIGGISSVVGLSAQGAITIATLSPITVNEDVVGAGLVTLTSADTGGGAADDNITVNATVSSTASSVTINSGDNIVFNAGGRVTALHTVTLVADTVGASGAVVNNTAGVVDIIADTTDITASNAIDVEVNVATVTRANSTVLGDVTLDDLGGGVNVNTSSTAAGTITLTATGGNLTVTTATASTGGGVGNIAMTTFTSGDINLGVATAAGDNVTLTSAGAIVDSTGPASNVISSTATFDSVRGVDLDTTVLTLTRATVTGVGAIDISNSLALGVMLATTANGNITIASIGDLTIGNDNTVVAGLDGGVHAGGSAGVVTLSSTTDIVDAADAGTDNLNVSGNRFVAISGSGIGDAVAGALESNVRFLEANGGTGGIALTNTGVLTVGGIGPLTATTAAAAISITASSPLTVAMNVTGASIALTTTNTAGDTSFQDDITINAGVTLQSTATTVTLTAEDDIILGGYIQTATNAILTAGGAGDVDGRGSIIDMHAGLDVDTGAGAGTGTVTLRATGNVAGNAIDIDTNAASVSIAVDGTGGVDLADVAGGVTVTSAITAGGDIVLNATGGNLVLTTVAAGGNGNVNARTTGSGSINVDSVTAFANDITLNAVGSIVDVNAGATNLTGATATLLAGTGIGDGDTLEVDLTTLNQASVSNGGAIDITESGSLNVLLATTFFGNIRLVTLGGDLALGLVNAASGVSDVTLSSTAAITDLNGGSVNVVGNNLTMSTGLGINVDTTVNTVVSATVSGSGNIDISETDDLTVALSTTFNGNITVAAGNNLTATSLTASTPVGVGNIALTAVTGNLTLGLVTAADDLVAATAGGSVIDGNAGNNVVALNLVISGRQGVGVSGAFGAIDTRVTNLEGDGGTGGFSLTNTGPLNIGGISSVEGVSAHGAITISTASPLTVNETVSSASDVTLTASTVATDGVDDCLDDLTINALVDGHNVFLNAADDVEVFDTVRASENLTIRAGDGVELNDFIFAGKTVSITTADAGVGNDDANGDCPNTLVFGTGGGIFADDIVINAAADITLGILKAVNTVAVTATGAGSDIFFGNTVSGVQGLVISGTSTTLVAAGDIRFRNSATTPINPGDPDAFIKAGTTLSMTATAGQIVDDEADAATAVDIFAPVVTARAGTGIRYDGQVDRLTSAVVTAASPTVANIDITDIDNLVVGTVSTNDASSVTLTTGGAIIDANGAATINVTARSLTATTGAGVNLNTSITTLTSASVSGDGDINIRNATGALLTATSATVTGIGDVTLTNNAAMIVTTATTANGDITLTTTTDGLTVGTATADQGDVSMTAVTDLAIGTATTGRGNVRGTAGRILAGTTVSAGLGSVQLTSGTEMFVTTVTSVDGNVTMTAGTTLGATTVTTTNGNAIFRAGTTVGVTTVTAGGAGAGDGSVVATATAGDILFDTITADGDSVSLTAAGAINESLPDGVEPTADIVAGSIFLSGTAGVGTANGPLEVNGSTLAGRFATGGFFVTDTAGGLTVGTVAGVSGVVDTALGAPPDAITIATLSPLTIAANVTGSGTVTLAAGESATPSVDNLTINGDALVSSSASNVVLSAGDNVDIFGFVSAAAGASTITAGANDQDATGSVTNVVNGISHVTLTGGTLTVGATGNNGNLGINLDTTAADVTATVTGTTSGGIRINNEASATAPTLTVNTTTTAATTGTGSVQVTNSGGDLSVTTATTVATTGNGDVTIAENGGALTVGTVSSTAVTTGTADVDISGNGGTTSVDTVTVGTTAMTTGSATVDVSGNGGLTTVTTVTTGTAGVSTGDASVSIDAANGLTVGTVTTNTTTGDASISVENSGGAAGITTLSATAGGGVGSVDVTSSGGALTLGAATTTAGAGDGSIDLNATGGLTTITTLSSTTTSGDASTSVTTDGGLTLLTSITTNATTGDASLTVNSAGGATSLPRLSATADGGIGTIDVTTSGGALTVGAATTTAGSGDASVDLNATGGLTTITTVSSTATTGDASTSVTTDGGLTVLTSIATNATTGDASLTVNSAGGATSLPRLSATADGGIGSIDVNTSGGTLTLGTATTSAGTGDASLDVNATGGATGITTLSATTTTGDGSISVNTDSALTLGSATTLATLGDAQIDVTGTGTTSTITRLSATATTGNSSILVDRDGGTLSVETALTSISDGQGTIDIHGAGGAVSVTTATATASAGGNVDIDISATGTVAGPAFLLTAGNITSTGLDGDITLSTTGSGNMSIGLLTAFLDRVTLDSTGNVTDGDAANDISTRELVVVADDGFGTADDPFETTVSFVEGTGGTLAFQERNNGALTIGILTNSGQTGVTSTTEIDIRTTGAASPESIRVVENVESAASSVLLSAIDTAGAGFADDVSIDPFVTVTAATDLRVSAGDDIVIAGTLLFGAAGGAANSATLTAGAGDVDTGGSIVDLNDAAENLIGLALASSLTASAVGANVPANGLAIDLDTRITTVTSAIVGAAALGTQAGGIRIEDTQFGLAVLVATTELGSITLSATGGTLAITTTSAGGAGNDIQLNTFTGMGASGPSTSASVTLGTATALDLVEVNSVASITDTNGAALNIRAPRVLLRAAAAVGAAGDPLEIDATFLAGRFDIGGFFVTDIDGVNADGIRITNLLSLAGTTVDGVQESNLTNFPTSNVVITAASPVFVLANVIASGNITLTAIETSDAPSFVDDIIVVSPEDLDMDGVLDPGEDTNGNGILDGVTIQSTLGDVNLFAGDDVFTAPTAVVHAFDDLNILAGFGDLDNHGGATLLGTHSSAGTTNVSAINDIVLGLFVAGEGLILLTTLGNILDGNGPALNILANGTSTFTATVGVIGLPGDAIEIESQNGQVIVNAGGAVDRVSVSLAGDIEPDGRLFTANGDTPGLILFNNLVQGGEGANGATDRFHAYTSDMNAQLTGEQNHGWAGFYTHLMLYLNSSEFHPQDLYRWDASMDGSVGVR